MSDFAQNQEQKAADEAPAAQEAPPEAQTQEVKAGEGAAAAEPQMGGNAQEVKEQA